MRHQAAQVVGIARAGLGASLADRGEQELVGAEVAVGACALVGQLAGDHVPAVADIADHHVIGDEAVLEADFVEVVTAIKVVDGPHLQTRAGQIDDELGQPLVSRITLRFSAHQRQEVMGAVGVAGPDLGSGYGPAAVDAGRARTHGRQVGTRVGLAHADSEKAFSPCDAREDLAPCTLAAVAQDLHRTLAVRDPVREDGRARSQHFLCHHELLQRGAAVTAVLRGQRQPDEARLAALATEVRRP